MMTIALQSITSIARLWPDIMMNINSILSQWTLGIGMGIGLEEYKLTRDNTEASRIVRASTQPNTLRAFAHIIEHSSVTINPAKISSNRINNVGDALEGYIKDAYAGLLQSGLSDSEKDSVYNKVFSWLGNSSNPPDSILRGGDGIEVKKIQSLCGGIALNSSSPKNKLYASDTRVATGAKTAENWTEKDIVYAIGSVIDQDLKRFWLIYGDCYAASKEVYDKMASAIADGVNRIPDIEFQTTNELGRVNKVDPLGITALRVRGMWHIDNPSRVYAELVSDTANRQFYVLMREEKYQSFPAIDRLTLENLSLAGYDNQCIKIRDPDNPAHLIHARFIKYEL